jgi:hypothetical protein
MKGWDSAELGRKRPEIDRCSRLEMKCLACWETPSDGEKSISVNYLSFCSIWRRD